MANHCNVISLLGWESFVARRTFYQQSKAAELQAEHLVVVGRMQHFEEEKNATH